MAARDTERERPGTQRSCLLEVYFSLTMVLLVMAAVMLTKVALPTVLAVTMVVVVSIYSVAVVDDDDYCNDKSGRPKMAVT